MLLPLVVVAAVAARFTYDDWAERRAVRRETRRAKALGQVATRRLFALDGEGRTSPADGERHGRTA
jgi:hypothetical protein